MTDRDVTIILYFCLWLTIVMQGRGQNKRWHKQNECNKALFDHLITHVKGHHLDAIMDAPEGTRMVGISESGREL